LKVDIFCQIYKTGSDAYLQKCWQENSKKLTHQRRTHLVHLPPHFKWQKLVTLRSLETWLKISDAQQYVYAWEANKNQTEQDTFFFYILNSVHNTVLEFKNYITQVAAFIVDTLIEPVPVLFMALWVISGRMTAT
jgi:hypothetical protein